MYCLWISISKHIASHQMCIYATCCSRYHMYGDIVHRLRVLVVRQTTSVVREASVIVVFQKEGNYGDSWNFGQVTLNSTADATVRAL